MVLDPLKLPHERNFWYLGKNGVLKFLGWARHPEWSMHNHRQCGQSRIVFLFQVGKLKFHACITLRMWNLKCNCKLNHDYSGKKICQPWGAQRIWVSIIDANQFCPKAPTTSSFLALHSSQAMPLRHTARKVFNSFQPLFNHIQGCVGCQMKAKTSIDMNLVVLCAKIKLALKNLQKWGKSTEIRTFFWGFSYFL